jgi:hypothetical protein
MTNSVQKDVAGPDWPLGFIAVATPGTPVGIMSLVDPSGVNDPATPTPGTAGAAEYSSRAYQIQFQGFKPGGAKGGFIFNAGFVYVVRRPVGAGSGGHGDAGCIVAILGPGDTYFLDAAPTNRNVWSPYRYSIDADNAGDGALVTLVIQ